MSDCAQMNMRARIVPNFTNIWPSEAYSLHAQSCVSLGLRSLSESECAVAAEALGVVASGGTYTDADWAPAGECSWESETSELYLSGTDNSSCNSHFSCMCAQVTL